MKSSTLCDNSKQTIKVHGDNVTMVACLVILADTEGDGDHVGVGHVLQLPGHLPAQVHLRVQAERVHTWTRV